MATLERFRHIPRLKVTAICDTDPLRIQAAQRTLIMSHRPEATEYTDHHHLCSDPGIDIVYIFTDWASHASIACEAMEAGKHVAVEVPIAMTVDDCHRVALTVNATRRRLFMLENCCFDPFHLRTLQMARQGVFGEITHCEGAYIHDLSGLYAENPWYSEQSRRHRGNPYPTHGIGPACMILDINRSDKLEYLVSVSGKAASSTVNSTLIHTVRGRSILLQYDVTTPRPYNRLQTVCGTDAYISKYPVEIFSSRSTGPLTADKLHEHLRKYTHPIEQDYGDDARYLGVENIMNYYMDRRIVDCMLHDTPFDISICDAALWSAIIELTDISSSQGGIPVTIPDFTKIQS